jgi:hypothetical protein
MRLSAPASALAVAALSALVPLTLARPASASLVLALDTPTMVQQADHIAVVDVVSVSAAWDGNHEKILTTIDLAVVEAWKGPMTPATHVKVVQPGGTVGELTMVVFGMSRFSTGERALVFLQGAAQNAQVVGMSQGKRAVQRDATSGRWWVHVPDRAGASFLRAAPLSPAVLPVFETRARPLDDLRGEIRGLVSKAKTP